MADRENTRKQTQTALSASVADREYMSAQPNKYLYNIQKRSLAAIEELDNFAIRMDSQPSGADLDLCDKWLRDLCSMYARVASMKGEAEGFSGLAATYCLQSVDEETFKRVKNSSTMFQLLVDGSYPHVAKYRAYVNSFENMLRSAIDSYRTLISAFKREKEYSSINQT